MTIALTVIGGITVIIGAASRVPPAAAAFLRACIPLVAAYRELRGACARGGAQAGAAGRRPGSREEPQEDGNAT